MKTLRRLLLLVAPGAIVAFALGACTDTETVFETRTDTVTVTDTVTRDVYTSPPEAANGFLGYFDVEEGMTTCGNCHVGTEATWDDTRHANAWEGLQASGHAREFCEGCHTVTELGNAVTEASGHNAVPEERYYDVQCESCHGPGLDHVQNPDGSQPLASLQVGLDLSTGCGECHQGSHHGFVDQWAQSNHAAPWGEFFPGGVDAGAAAALRPSCQACHLGQGALAAWGVEGSYIEAGADPSTEDRLAITCGVCHDPHGSSNQAMLRFPINVASAEQHLCARCHNRRTTPNPESSHGLHPHAPETALLQGDVGWIPPGAEINRGEIIATHGSEANPGLCATCHVASFEVTDQETGEFVFNATGHTFNAVPCVDADGVPTGGDCELSTDARTFEGCTASGCHGTQQAAFSALSTAATRIQDLSTELHDLLLQVDPGLEDAGGEIDPNDPTFTVAEGAFFNLATAEFPEGERVDARMVYAGSSAHNPFMMEQLLIASINAVEAEYGVSASPGFVASRLITLDR